MLRMCALMVHQQKDANRKLHKNQTLEKVGFGENLLIPVPADILLDPVCHGDPAGVGGDGRSHGHRLLIG